MNGRSVSIALVCEAKGREINKQTNKLRRLSKTNRAKLQHLFKQYAHVLCAFKGNYRDEESPVLETMTGFALVHNSCFAVHSISVAKGDAQSIFETRDLTM